MNKHKNTKKHRKTNHKKRKQYTRNNKHKITRHKNKRQYTKRSYKHNVITSIPRSQSIPIFTKPEKIHSTNIIINKEHNYGNIISGLRNFLKK
jgi:hypothetical protein